MFLLHLYNNTNGLKFKYIVYIADIAYNTYNLSIICEAEMGQVTDRNRELFELAESQQGFFTAKQAESIGYIKTNHAYHVKTGHWVREARGVYRLALFPRTPDEQKILYSLWSQNREGLVQGVYSHETALAHYELSDINPSKLHMTVPTTFRRNSKIPKALVLHYADLTEDMILKSRGFFVTKPGRTLSDVIQSGWVPFDIIQQAVSEAISRGLMHRAEVESILAHVQVPTAVRKQLDRLQKDIQI